MGDGGEIGIRKKNVKTDAAKKGFPDGVIYNPDPITLVDVVNPRPKPYRDPIVLYGVSLLVVAALSFYGGFRYGVERKAYNHTQTYLAIGRACIDYVGDLKPRKVVVKPDVPLWIARNCGQIAERSMERINGIRTGEIKGKK